MWCSNDMFHYMLKAEFVTASKFKSPVGKRGRLFVPYYCRKKVLWTPQQLSLSC